MSGDWLPWQALDDPRVAGDIKGAVSRWSGRWFKAAPVYEFGLSARERVAALPEARKWLSRGHGLGFDLDGDLILHLACQALNAPNNGEINPSDHPLLMAVGHDMVDDLSLELAALLGIESSIWSSFGAPIEFGAQKAWLECEIAFTNGKLRIAIPQSVAVQMRKDKIGSAAKSPPHAVSLRALLSEERIAFTAILGSAEIALSDVRSLSVGDVVILDNGPGEGIEIVSGDGSKAIGTAKLVAGSAGTQLIMSVG